MPNIPDNSSEGSENAIKDLLKQKRDKIEKELQQAKAYETKQMGMGGRAQALASVLKTDPREFTGLRATLHHWISWWGFDAFIGLVIVCNAVTIGWETQSKASVPIGCTPDCDCKRQIDLSETCSTMPEWVELADYVFFGVYAVEFLLRLAVYGPYVLKSHWIKFDLFLILASATDFVLKTFSDSETFQKIMLVRMLRLARLARALRLMVQFQTLWQLVQGLLHSIGTLLWTFLLVMVLMYIGAVVGMEFIKVDTTLPLDHPYNTAAADNFKSFGDAMMTLLQIFSFDSIGGIYRPLIRHRTWLFVYFMVAMLLLSIALMNLVTAVMVNSSLDQASEDKEARKAWEAVKKAKQIEDLKAMFKELDEDGSGELTIDEIEQAPEEAQLQLQEIAGTDNLRELFEMLDFDGGGTVGVEEFCDGVLKATNGQPATLELGRLVKQCSDILKNSRDTVSILTDPSSGFAEFAYNQASGKGGGSSMEGLQRLDNKVTNMENELASMQTEIQRALQTVNEKMASSKSKSTGNRQQSHSPTRKHEHRSGHHANLLSSA
eukprot:TRINITY_DN31213_c0_g1_i1.p1 TRINITY_DN31213_c0_g1~~TRINITY_DN31213_c0_g1_i1.p1  ORF type:complete len:580 (-),score=121.60 TRINITY_DN31213_c0_g1_i1:26-1672(-)